MHITYFPDTDTLDIDFRATRAAVAQTVDGPDPDLLVDFDEQGRIVGLTIEHASRRIDLDSLRRQRQFDEVVPKVTSTH